MSVFCPKCHREYDIALFQFGISVPCDCGELLRADTPKIRKLEKDRGIKELQKRADEICRLILNTDYPLVDIQIAIEKLRSHVKEIFPDKEYLFKMIYEKRFERLWEQFREKEVR